MIRFNRRRPVAAPHSCICVKILVFKNSENSKDGYKFILGLTLGELKHFDSSKFLNNFLNINDLSWLFQRCREIENCCHLLSNTLYNCDLKLKISRDAEEIAKNFTKSLFRRIWVLVILPFWDFVVQVILPFSKISDHLPPHRGL